MIAGRGLAAAGQGDLLPALAALLAFALLTAGGFAGCVWIADNLYAAGWVRMQSSGSAERGRQRTQKFARNAGLLGRAPASVAIMLKDWRVIPRDLRNFAQILSPLLFLPIIYINLVNSERRLDGPGGPQGIFEMSDLTGVLLAAGVLTSTVLIFGRIAGTSISMEGKSWWLLKAAPISSDELLLGKYLSVLVPFVLLSSLLLLGAAVWRGFNLGWLLYGWYGVETLGAAMLAVELGLAVPWARLDWDDPRKMGSGLGALLAIVIWVGLAVTSGLLLCLPLLAEVFEPSLVLQAALLGALLSSAISFGAAYLVLKFGSSRLMNVGEA
jgi:hypothetical protein